MRSIFKRSSGQGPLKTHVPRERWLEGITPKCWRGENLPAVVLFLHYPLSFMHLLSVPLLLQAVCGKQAREWRWVGFTGHCPWRTQQSSGEVSVLWAGKLQKSPPGGAYRHLNRELDLCGGWFEQFLCPRNFSAGIPPAWETAEEGDISVSLEGVYLKVGWWARVYMSSLET